MQLTCACSSVPRASEYRVTPAPVVKVLAGQLTPKVAVDVSGTSAVAERSEVNCGCAPLTMEQQIALSSTGAHRML